MKDRFSETTLGRMLFHLPRTGAIDGDYRRSHFVFGDVQGLILIVTHWTEIDGDRGQQR